MAPTSSSGLWQYLDFTFNLSPSDARYLEARISAGARKNI